MTVGIDKISFYVPAYYVALRDIAQRDGVDIDKFHIGLGQECFSVAPHDEDSVTMAANAAVSILNDADKAAIDTVLFATESGIDNSKSAAVYVHHLLALSPNCRAVELKQACYSATAGLQMACAYVAANPKRKVLLLASDIARYTQFSAAEATQGCAGLAMVVSANPRIAVISPHAGLYTEEVMDFWRPIDSETPLVDGKLSTRMYLRAAQQCWVDYQQKSGDQFADMTRYCYHLPFSKMAIKAHQRLCQLNHLTFDEEQIADGMYYNRVIGNTYTAALYISLCAVLDHGDDMTGKKIGMMSYGSGCVAEYFSLQIQPGYRAVLAHERHAQQIATRIQLSIAQYNAFWQRPDLVSTQDIILPTHTRGKFRLAGIRDRQRQYEAQS